MLQITATPTFLLHGTGVINYPVQIIVNGNPADGVCCFVTADLDGQDTGRMITGAIFTDSEGKTYFDLDTGFYWLNWSKTGFIEPASQRIEVTANVL